MAILGLFRPRIGAAENGGVTSCGWHARSDDWCDDRGTKVQDRQECADSELQLRHAGCLLTLSNRVTRQLLSQI